MMKQFVICNKCFEYYQKYNVGYKETTSMVVFWLSWIVSLRTGFCFLCMFSSRIVCKKCCRMVESREDSSKEVRICEICLYETDSSDNDDEESNQYDSIDHKCDINKSPSFSSINYNNNNNNNNVKQNNNNKSNQKVGNVINSLQNVLNNYENKSKNEILNQLLQIKNQI